MARRKTHPGSIEKRAGSFRVRLGVNGERHYFTLPGATRKQAEEFAREKYRELKKQAKRQAMGLPGSIAFSELLERYEEETLPTLAPNTVTGYKVTLRAFTAFFVEKLGDPRLDHIQAGHVQRFLDWRRVHGPDGEKLKGGLSNRTIQKERAVLHRLFKLADRLELRDGNPVARTESPKIRERDPVILSDPEYEKLLAECYGRSAMLGLYALVLGETGARCESEALQLRWEDVRLEDGFIWIDSAYHGRRTKSGKGRWCPMTPRLLQAMREHFASYRFVSYDGERSPWIFHHERRNRGAMAGDRIRSFRRSLMKAAAEAKLPEGFVQHDLRHRRVTKWLGAGANPVHVKEAVGHADLATTMGYTHLAKEHLRALVDPEETGQKDLREVK